MKIICIRHTKVHVSPGICYGQSNVGLAASYPEELQIIKGKMDGYTADQLFSSPLTRCKRLAEDLFQTQQIYFDDRLKELNFGDWEMQNWDEISQSPLAKEWFNDFVNFQSPGGESFFDQINRVEDFLNDLKKQTYSTVILVTHGGTIRAINCILNQINPLDAFKSKVDYGEICAFELK